MTCPRLARTPSLIGLASLLLSACVTDGSMLGDGTSITASDPTRMTRSGFLSDYGRLKATEWGGGIECWRAADLAAERYDKIMVARIVVSMAPPKGKENGKDKEAEPMIDPSDLKTLTDYFHSSLEKTLKPQLTIVDKAGPNVLVLRIALTHLVPTTVSDSVMGTLIPYAFVAEAGSGVATGRPAGSTPYMGETGMEMQFRDGATGAVLGECRDTEIGRKYAAEGDSGAGGAAQTWAGGYLNSFQAWSYAKNAFDKWSLLVAQRLAQLRGVAPAKP